MIRRGLAVLLLCGVACSVEEHVVMVDPPVEDEPTGEPTEDGSDTEVGDTEGSGGGSGTTTEDPCHEDACTTTTESTSDDDGGSKGGGDSTEGDGPETTDDSG